MAHENTGNCYLEIIGVNGYLLLHDICEVSLRSGPIAKGRGKRGGAVGPLS